MVTADAVDRFVAPFYLRMMATNALLDDAPSPASIVAACRSATPADVGDLLRRGWRETVMGAWLSTRHTGAELPPEVVTDATRRCGGSLTAAPLMAACVIAGGRAAQEALEHHAATGRDDPHLARSALHHLRPASAALPAPDAATRDRFAGLLRVGEQIRTLHRSA